MTFMKSNTMASKHIELSTDDISKPLTNEEISALGNDIIGFKVIVCTREGTSMGVVHSLLIADRKIMTLGKLTDPETGKRILGMRRLFFQDIINMTVIGIDRELRQKLMKHCFQEDQRGKQLLMKKVVPLHLANRDEEMTLVDEDILLGRVMTADNYHGVNERNRERDRTNGEREGALTSGKENECMNYGSGKTVHHSVDDANGNTVLAAQPPPPPPGVNRPDKWIVIDKIDDAFWKAMNIIRSENEISIGIEGKKTGRLGTLAWCSVATSTIIFLFDVATIGASQLLGEGLSEVLTDGRILKVIHDCRCFEDYLHHRFGIGLKNVFDTQVAEIYLHVANHRDTVPTFVSNLPSLLVRYMKLAPHHVFFSHVREECSQGDEMVWFERPPSESLCEGMARNVMYLRELRLVLLQLMVVDFTQMTNIYLGSVRDKDTATATSMELQLVPEDIRKLRRRRVNNAIDVHDPYIVYSRDAFKIIKQRK